VEVWRTGAGAVGVIQGWEAEGAQAHWRGFGRHPTVQTRRGLGVKGLAWPCVTLEIAVHCTTTPKLLFPLSEAFTSREQKLDREEWGYATSCDESLRWGETTVG